MNDKLVHPLNKSNIVFCCSECGTIHEWKPIMLFESSGELWVFCSRECIEEFLKRGIIF